MDCEDDRGGGGGKLINVEGYYLKFPQLFTIAEHFRYSVV